MREPLRQKIRNEAELSQFASAFAAVIGKPARNHGIEISLDGELGAGKTTLVRHLAFAMHVAEPVSSPSYVLQHEYHSKDLLLEHWDLYRLGDLPDELVDPVRPGVVRLVEWACHAPEYLKRSSYRITLRFGGSGPLGEERLLECDPDLA